MSAFTYVTEFLSPKTAKDPKNFRIAGLRKDFVMEDRLGLSRGKDERDCARTAPLSAQECISLLRGDSLCPWCKEPVSRWHIARDFVSVAGSADKSVYIDIIACPHCENHCIVGKDNVLSRYPYRS